MARWERNGSTRVAEYGVFSIDRHEFRRLDTGAGKTIHTIETVDWCNVVPITRDDRIVLVRQHRFGIHDASIEIPGGIVDPGEAPLATAARELREETGYVADEVVPLGVVNPNPALQPTRLHMFLARGCTLHPDGQHLEELEDCEVLVVDRAELDALVRSGAVVHALVWAALHAWHLHEKQSWR